MRRESDSELDNRSEFSKWRQPWRWARPTDLGLLAHAQWKRVRRILVAHLDEDVHARLVLAAAEIGSRQRRRLCGIARDRDADQVLSADQSVGWVEFDPAGAGQVDLAPRVSRPATQPRLFALR